MKNGILLIGAVLLAVILLSNGPGRGPDRDNGLDLPRFLTSPGIEWIQDTVNSSIPGSVTWEEHDILPLRGAVTLYNVKLETPDGRTAAGIERIHVNIALPRLIGRNVHIKELLIVGLTMQITADENVGIASVFTGQDEPEQSGGQSEWSFQIDSMEVHEGNVAVLVPEQELQLRTGPFEVILQTPLPGRKQLRYSAGTSRLEYKGGSTQFAMDLNAALRSSGVMPVSMDLRILDENVQWASVSLESELDLPAPVLRPLDSLLLGQGGRNNGSGKVGSSNNGAKRNSAPAAAGASADTAADITADTAAAGRLLSYTFQVDGDIQSLQRVSHILSALRLPPAKAAAAARAQQQSLRGSASFDVSGEGSGFSLNEIDLSASMNARADGLGYGQMPLVSPLSVDSSIRLAGGLLSIERASVRGPGTEVDANGTYRLKPRIVHGEADVRLGPLRQLQLLQGKRELQGMFQISMQVDGPVKNPEASIDVRGEELRYGDFPAGDSPAGNFQMSASLTGGNLVISEMDMSTGEASAAVSGSIGLIESDEVEDEDRAEDNEQSMRESFPLDLEVAARGFTLDRYIDAVPVQGLAAVDAQVKGTVQNPEVRAELVLDGIRYSDFAAGSGTLEVGFSNGVLRIEDGYLARGDSRVSFQGTTRLLAGKGRQQDRTSGPPQDLTGEENGLPAFDLLVRGEDLSIGDYLPDPGKREGDPGMSGIAGVSGRISVSAHLEGTASQPDLSVQVRGRDLSAVQNVEMFSARIGYQDKTLRLHELAADLNGSEPEGEVYASGWYRPGAAFEIEAGSPGIPLADLQPLAAVSAAENTEEVRDREDAEHEKGTESAKDTKSAEYEKAAESAEALPGTAPAGLLKFDIQGSGTVSDPRIQGSVTVADFSAGGTRLGDHRLNVAMRDRNINVNGNVGFPVRASYGLDSKSFSLEARLENTSFTPYLSLAGVQDFGGRITGTVSAQGNLSDMETVQGSVYLSYLMVTSGQERIAQTSDIRVVLEDGRFTMDPFRVYFPVLRLPGEGEKQAILAVQGAGELGGELDISVQGSFPAELAGRFTEQLANPVGRVNLQARVGGTIENPVLQGSLNIRGLGFAVTATGQQFYGIRGDVHMTPETVNVQKLTGRLDEGSFTLSGTLEYDTEGPGPVSMDISTVALPVRVPGTADLVLNLDLNFSGVPDETLAAGEVAILEGVFFGELGLKQVDEKLAQTPGSVRPEPDIPYLREVQLDVDVLTRSPFVVDHNLALLYLSPEVRVYGTFEEPLVNGRVNIDSGAFVLRGTEFEVTRGSVTFTDPYRINPYIEVEAETEIRQYNIMLRAVGPPDDLNLSLRSVPSLPDEDILSLILIGRTAGELARGEGEQLTPDQMLARVAGSLLSDQVGELVGLDVLEVEFPDVQEEEQETGVRVTLGVELSKRLDLEHSLQSTEEGLVQRTSAEYKLLDRVLIRVFQNTLGAFGGELQYRVDFR